MLRIATGKQYLRAATLEHYNYFRDYDPSIARYIESDPIGLLGGINTYSYSVDNPLAYFDVKGQDARAGARIGARIGAGIGTAIEPGGGTAIGAAIGAAAGAAIGYIICTNNCPPCDPPAGTVCYILNVVPPAKPHYPFVTHVHLFQMNQSPTTCECFWNKNDPDVLAFPPPWAKPCTFSRGGAN